MPNIEKKRTYGQFCSVAKALDLVGDRWTLLLVRELLTGPKRYKDLLGGLEGIGTNLLAARLKQLEADGLLRKTTLPPPASVDAYELTPLGQALEPVYHELVRWGYRLLEDRGASEIWRVGWSVLTLKALFDADAAQGLDVAVEFRIGSETFFGAIRNGNLNANIGPAPSPDAVVTSSPDAFLDVALGHVDLTDSLASGDTRLDGDPEAVLRFMVCFPRPADPVQSPR